VLGWLPGTCLDLREHTRVIVVRPATDGVHRVDDRGYLCLPLAVRRWCGIAAPATPRRHGAYPVQDWTPPAAHSTAIAKGELRAGDLLINPAGGGARNPSIDALALVIFRLDKRSV
jgi:hypothetical protein